MLPGTLLKFWIKNNEFAGNFPWYLLVSDFNFHNMDWMGILSDPLFFFLFFYDTGFNMFLFQFLESKYLPNFFLFPPLDFFCGVLYWCRIHRKVKQENTGPFIFLNLRFSRVLFKIIHNTYRLRPERDSPSLLQSLIYPWGTTVKRNHWILKASRRGKVLLVLNLY